MAGPGPSSDLSQLLGGSPLEEARPTEGGVSPSSSGLVALVGPPGGRADDAGWNAPEGSRAGRRPLFPRRKRGAVNYLSIGLAVFATIVLVGVASFALVQRATANPADDAMISLREREAQLQNEIKQAQTSVDMYVASTERATDSTAMAIEVLRRLEGEVGAEKLTAAESARATLDRVASARLDVSVPKYTRAPIDEKSLADVGHAIDTVRGISDDLPALIVSVRDARANVQAAAAAFQSALSEVSDALRAEALERVDAVSGGVDERFLGAVLDGANRLRDAQSAGGDGLAEMDALITALDGLDAEDERVRAEFRGGPARPAPTVPRYSPPPASSAPSQAPTEPASEEPSVQQPTPIPSASSDAPTS